MVIEWTAVHDDVYARRGPSVVLLDTRPKGQYTGAIVNGAVRGGHIPHAINIEGLRAIDGTSQLWKSMDELTEMYPEIPKDKTVYAYCHDGFRNTLAYMQLKALGYEDVRLYNGGWAH